MARASWAKNTLNIALASAVQRPEGGKEDIVAAMIAGTIVSGSSIVGLAAGMGAADGIAKAQQDYEDYLKRGYKSKIAVREDDKRVEACFIELYIIISHHDDLLTDWNNKVIALKQYLEDNYDIYS